MTFPRRPSRSPAAPRPEERISAKPEVVEQLQKQGVHPAKIPVFPSWHPASQRGRCLQQAQTAEPEVVVEEEALPPTGRLGKVPSDLAAAIDASFSERPEVGSDARLSTDRFGKHHVVVAEGEKALHPGLRSADQAIGVREKWRATADAQAAIDAITEQFGGHGRTDENGFPVQPPPEPYQEPAEASATSAVESKVEKMDDSWQKIAALAREDPELLAAVIDARERERNKDGESAE